ncbi:MAG: hypothetical protein ABIK65_10375 [Candidatus Eisenbacteria bacterium]
MRRRPGFALIMILLAPAIAFGGTHMDREDVLALIEAGVSERLIVAQIETSGSDFALTTDDILELEEMGVSERILEAMILSGGGDGSMMEVADAEEAAEVAVPAHLGFYRYESPTYVDVRMVPWSVPNVRYVYVDYDPWYWDPWWWDTPFYVSYNYYPRWHSNWYLSWRWNPYRWYGYHYAGWGGHHHHGHHYTSHYYHDSSYHDGVASRAGTWKKKTVKRGTTTAAVSGTRAYQTRSKSEVRTPSRTSTRKTYGRPGSATARGSTVSTARSRGSEGSKSTVTTRRAPQTQSEVRSAPRGRSGNSSVSRPAPSRSSGSSRAAPSRGSGSPSSGGRKTKSR